jgi:RHS repeat-associated protein
VKNRLYNSNNRAVINEFGVVRQVTNYYPFGAPYADASASTNTDFQPYKYNGKEFDKMHGLNTYDYGARQYNPITARWDRMDPLAEKYYSISPYVYCMNNPIIHVDPDGKEKKSYLSKEETQNSDYNLYPENTPGVLNIWAHGTKELETNKYSWSIKVDRHYIDNATDLRRFVLCHCKEWINNQGRNIIIVLHACSSSNLAKIMSAQDIFKGKNITIIAPNAKLKKNRVGSVVNSKMYFDSDTKKVVGKEEGQWRVYKDGELINTLPADAQPGLTNKKELDILIKDKK